MKKEFDQEIIEVVWKDKYRFTLPDGTSDEKTPADSKIRMVKGVYANDPNKVKQQEAINACVNDLLIPGGRVAAGAGTPKRVTWINCFVNQDIHDSMEGIMSALSEAAFTQQQGGGIGSNFSTLRPSGALVKRTGSVSTGPLPFMDMWHAMCQTIKSSGSRRGAMMGTLADWHPDLPAFIVAKQEKGRLTNFNVSVLVSDALMDAVEKDAMWDLGFHVEPADPSKIVDRYQKEGKTWYVYQRLKARELWDTIIKNTYDWAEPGVIFIDRINQMNNLYYCEDIRCTNPCGEQPLPARGDCNLVHVNLARMVKNPFTDSAIFDYELLQMVTKIAVRFGDNVVDVSTYPLSEQKEEAQNKRRIGLGYSGLANAMQMLGVRYGHKNSVDMTESIGQVLRDAAYSASIELAKERGSFPLFDKDKYLKGKFIQTLPGDIRDSIAQSGIRSGVVLTIAPVGTGSLYYGNISSGLEPTIFWKASRKMLMPDNSYREFDVVDYGYQKFCEHFGEVEITNLPYFMVVANQLSVDEHLAIQAAAQKYVDSSISKTINCPKEMSYEDFKKVYKTAFDSGLKGVTTFRPSDVRGAVITAAKKSTNEIKLIKRPDELPAIVYKARMPGITEAYYITISDVMNEDGVTRPFEIFINSKSVKNQEWITALTRTISAVFRRGGDLTFLIEELSQVYSLEGGGFQNGVYVPSIVAMIGDTIRKHFEKIGLIEPRKKKKDSEISVEICPSCQMKSYYHTEGCGKCNLCGYSSC